MPLDAMIHEEQGYDYPLGYVRWTEQRNFEAVLELMVAGKLNVKPLITHRFPFGKAPDAYELITSRKEPYLEYTKNVERINGSVATIFLSPRRKARKERTEDGFSLLGVLSVLAREQASFPS